MEAKEILSQVKQFFTELMAPAPPDAAAPPAPDAPKEYDLKDGGKVTIDKLEVGGMVMIDGNPALPGDIELADGTKITVAENGVIAVIVPVEPVVAPPAPEDMNTKFTAFETATNQRFSDYEIKFSAQELQLSKMQVSLGKATKVIEKLMELSTLIVEAPAPPDPATRVPNAFQKEKEIKEDFIDNLSKNL